MNKKNIKNILILFGLIVIVALFTTGNTANTLDDNKDLEKTSEMKKATTEDVNYEYEEGKLTLDWGTKNTGGYEITIDNLLLDNNILVIDYKLVSPGNAPVPQVITYPKDSVKVPEEKRDFEDIELNLVEHKVLSETEENLNNEDDTKEPKNYFLNVINKFFNILIG